MADWDIGDLLNTTPGIFATGRGDGLRRNMSLGSLYPERTPLQDHIWFKVFAIVSYSLVFIASIFGNLLVIVVILCHKQMRSAVNFFLGNLAIADLCVGIFCVLPALFKYLSQVWMLGRVLCKMHNFVQCLNYTCSIIILTVISVERYIIISHPLWNKRYSGGWHIHSTVVGLIWLASIAYSVPNLISYDLRETSSSNETFYFCVRSNQLISYETYAMIDMTLLYVLPLLLMTVVYVRISIVLWRSNKLDVRTHSVDDQSVPAKTSTKQRWHGKWKHPMACCSCGCRGSLERGQSPWQESIALKVECHDEGPKMMDSSAGTGATVFSQPKNGLRPEWTVDQQMHQIEPCAETANRRPNDALSASSSSSALAAAAAATKASSHPYQIRRLKTLKLPQHQLLNEPKQRQQGRPLLMTTHQHGKLKHAVLSSTASTSTGSNRLTPSKAPLVQLRRRRVIRLLVAIIVSFAVCTLPNHVRVQYQIWSPHIFYGQMYAPPITMLLFYMNSAINPILYAFISRKFRRTIVMIDWRFLWRKIVRRETTSSDRYTVN